MKYIVILLSFIMSWWDCANAQTIVSTEPANRNVVLEEFTGMYCGWCPDGHKIATELSAKYDGRIFPINIHTGSFAFPSDASDLDFRTSAGDSIGAAAYAVSFPTGSVNRQDYPWAQSRSLWESKAVAVMAEASPVNIAVEANVDLNTRELNVTVEYYYTADEEHPTNHLSVFLSQSEIIGEQSNGIGLNPDFVNEEGLYRHQHALRMALTESVWGDEIAETKKGSFGRKEFKLILPNSIKNIPLDITQLDVVAFIAPEKKTDYHWRWG